MRTPNLLRVRIENNGAMHSYNSIRSQLSDYKVIYSRMVKAKVLVISNVFDVVNKLVVCVLSFKVS